MKPAFESGLRAERFDGDIHAFTVGQLADFFDGTPILSSPRRCWRPSVSSFQGKHPVTARIVIDHKPVEVIHKLGAGVTGYEVGDREEAMNRNGLASLMSD